MTGFVGRFRALPRAARWLARKLGARARSVGKYPP